MKLPILTAAVFLLVGTTASMYARQEKGQDDHSQEAKPAKQEAKPAERPETQNAKPTPQAKPTQQAKTTPQQQPKAKPAERQQTQSVKPAPQQHTQEAATSKQQPAGKTQARAQQSDVHATSGASEHGRISNAHYTASFGSGHSFHVNQGDYAHRRFQYGGYSFGFIDAWPVAWGYSDNVYVVYVDGGYYMYDAFHPGLRISLNIL